MSGEERKIADVRPHPEDGGINEHWMSILRWAVRRSGKATVRDLTEDEVREAQEAWKRGERPEPMP